MIHHEIHLNTHQSKFVTKLICKLKKSTLAKHIQKTGIKQKESDNSFKIRVPVQKVLAACHLISLSCISSKTHNLQEVLFSLYLHEVHKTTVVVPGVPSGNRGNWG